MVTEHSTQMRVECTECGFVAHVGPDDEKRPHEVVVEHGVETGHTLSLTSVGH